MSEPRLPRLADGGTVVCLAPGPSLCREDVEYVRGKATVIAINNAVTLAPWADVIYSSDQLWWNRNAKAMRALPGIKVRVHATHQKVTRGLVGAKYCQGCRRRLIAQDKGCWCAGIVSLFNDGVTGLSLGPDAICTTNNSGGAAINVAVLLGAKTVLLVGYDMGPDEKGRRHFDDVGPAAVTSPYQNFRKHIATMVEPLKKAGITVLNCSRFSRLECFPRVSLREALVAQAA